MNCAVCGEELSEDDNLAAPEPKAGSGKTREDTVGHRHCWYQEGFRDLTPQHSPLVAKSRTNSWLENIEIESTEEVIQ